MKVYNKLLVVLLVFTMLTSSLGSICFATGIDPEFVSFSADCYGIEVGQSSKVTFTAKSRKTGLTNLKVYDDNGNAVATLTETEPYTYEGSAIIPADEKCVTSYNVICAGKKFGDFEIRSYNKLTKADEANNDATWNKLKKLRTSLEQKNVDKKYILSAAYKYLQADPDVASVWYESDEIINFETVSGIQNIFSMAEQKTGTSESFKNTMEMLSEIVEESAQASEYDSDTKSDDDYIGNKEIGVFAPYYGVEDEFTMSYYTIAESINMELDGNITGYYGNGSHGYPACYVSTFKNFDRFGIVMVDSHGDLYSGSSVICVNFAGSYDSSDISQGHLVRGYDYIGVKGSYMKKYCDDLPNSIVYLGNCYGMKTSSLYSPLMDIGAQFVVGYDNPVSFQFDARIGTEFMRKLKVKSSVTGLYNTCIEAYDAAVARYGMTDPYSSYKANFVYRGNKNMRIIEYSTITVESIALSQSELSMQVGDTVNLEVIVNPDDAVSYEVTWETFSESIAKVSSSGKVQAVSEGSTIILCTVVDTLNDNSFAEMCNVTVTSGADTFIVTFIDMDGEIIDTQNVNRGDDAVPPTPPTHDGYIFDRWEGDYKNVTENRAITAKYGLIGDANGDNKINTGDAVTVLRHTVGLASLSGINEKCADYNQDGTLNTGDAVAILLYTVY